MNNDINFLLPISINTDNPNRIADAFINGNKFHMRVWTNEEDRNEVNIWIEDLSDNVGCTIMISLSCATAFCLSNLILNAIDTIDRT